MSLGDMFGQWLAVFWTFCIFSFLYKDNPFYRFAEHVFVGVSAGYWMCIIFWEVLYTNLWLRLAAGDLRYLLAAALGLMLVLRLVPGIGWVGRWPMAFLVGMQAGYSIVYTMQAQVLKQIEATMVPLWVAGDPAATVINWILVVGVLTGLVYFYFSMEHQGPIFGGLSRVGIWILMIAFGAAFGYTVMSRVSLLIGRVMAMQEVWDQTLAFFGAR